LEPRTEPEPKKPKRTEPFHGFQALINFEPG
jgi:hypothetical protein